MSFEKVAVGTCCGLYSCGLGQALAVPGAVISAALAGVFKIQKIRSAKKFWTAYNHYGTTPETFVLGLHAERCKARVFSALNYSRAFAIGGIPVLGALYAVENWSSCKEHGLHFRYINFIRKSPWAPLS